MGLDFNYDSLQLSDYRISCVGTALKLYNQMGEKIYCEALRLIVAAWEGKPDSFRASVLRGMMHFVELYHGEFSEERLIRALRIMGSGLRCRQRILRVPSGKIRGFSANFQV